MGANAFEARREELLQHQELLNQQLHDLHRLWRGQRLLVAALHRPATYQQELRRLTSQEQVRVLSPYCSTYTGSKCSCPVSDYSPGAQCR